MDCVFKLEWILPHCQFLAHPPPQFTLNFKNGQFQSFCFICYPHERFFSHFPFDQHHSGNRIWFSPCNFPRCIFLGWFDLCPFCGNVPVSMETQEDIVVVCGLNHPLPLSTDWTDALVEKKTKNVWNLTWLMHTGQSYAFVNNEVNRINYICQQYHRNIFFIAWHSSMN